MKNKSLTLFLSIILSSGLTLSCENTASGDETQATGTNPSIGTSISTLPTKVAIDSSAMAVTTTLQGGYQFADAETAETCPSGTSDPNSLMNMGFYLGCAAAQTTREMLIGKNAGDVDCKDSIEDGILGGIGCNVPEGLISMKPFTEDGETFAISFEDFTDDSATSYTGQNKWSVSGDSIFPMVIRFWYKNSDTQSPDPVSFLNMQSRNKGTVVMDIGSANSSKPAIMKSTFDLDVDSSSCSASNASASTCKNSDFYWYISDCTGLDNDEPKSLHIKALADKPDDFTFAQLQYHLEFCGDQSSSDNGVNFSYRKIVAETARISGKTYFKIEYRDSSNVVQDFTGTSLLLTLLNSWMDDLNSGKCYPAVFNYQNLWSGFGTNYTDLAGAYTYHGITDGICDGASLTFDSSFAAADANSAALPKSGSVALGSVPSSTQTAQ